MTAQSGYVIAGQAAISIEMDEFGDVILRQGKSTITINSTNLAGLIDILINIDDGTGYDRGHRVDWEAILPDLNSPPTAPAPVNSVRNVNSTGNADVNAPVNKAADRKVAAHRDTRTGRSDSPRSPATKTKSQCRKTPRFSAGNRHRKSKSPVQETTLLSISGSGGTGPRGL